MERFTATIPVSDEQLWGEKATPSLSKTGIATKQNLSTHSSAKGQLKCFGEEPRVTSGEWAGERGGGEGREKEEERERYREKKQRIQLLAHSSQEEHAKDTERESKHARERWREGGGGIHRERKRESEGLCASERECV